MKRPFKPIVLFFCAGLIMSCAKKNIPVLEEVNPINPISDYTFTRDPTDYFTFNFTSLASKYTKLEWRFGDDSVSTVPSPTHTFLATGDLAKKFIYTVDLKTTSSTGGISHKYTDIAIIPDSVLTMSAVKTSTPNQVQFGTTVKADVASALWTFTDQGAIGSPGGVTTSTQLTPLHTYIPNTVNQVSVKITTKKGAVVSISRPVTPAGIIQDITQTRTGFFPNSENLVNTEVSKNLVDGNTATKFTLGTTPFTYPFIAVFTFATPVAVKEYAIGNCDNLPARDVKAWTFEGSNDGVTWTILDNQLTTMNFYNTATALGATTDAQRYYKLFYFAIANPQPFTQYRWRVTANWGDAKIQTSEFQLYK